MDDFKKLSEAKLGNFFDLVFEKMNKSRKDFIIAYVLSLIVQKTVNSKEIAKGLNGEAKASSNEHRIYSFFSDYDLDYNEVAVFMLSILSPKHYIVCIDRTNWSFGKNEINVLALTVYYHGVGIPIFWMDLDKKGNSNTGERIELIERFISLFGCKRIKYLTADREFIGEKWILFLRKNNIDFYIRIRKDTLVEYQGHKQHAKEFCRSDKETLFLMVKIWGLRLNMATKVIQNPDDPDDGFLILITPVLPLGSCECYRNRWSIEVCFSCWKTRGFNLEDTHMTEPDRINKLIAMVAIAYLWSVALGVWSHQNERKITVKNHSYKTVSFFRKGLDILQECLNHLSLKFQKLLQYLDIIIHIQIRNLTYWKLELKGYKVSLL